MPSADTSASCLYSNLHSVTVGHRRGLRAFRKSPAPRGYAMRMQRCISVRRSRTDESEEKQAAAVLAAKCRIAAATYRTRLRIGTACGIFSIFYWGTRDIPPKKAKTAPSLGPRGSGLPLNAWLLGPTWIQSTKSYLKTHPFAHH